jgi:hypothetical protein
MSKVAIDPVVFNDQQEHLEELPRARAAHVATMEQVALQQVQGCLKNWERAYDPTDLD